MEFERTSFGIAFVTLVIMAALRLLFSDVSFPDCGNRMDFELSSVSAMRGESSFVFVNVRTGWKSTKRISARPIARNVISSFLLRGVVCGTVRRYVQTESTKPAASAIRKSQRLPDVSARESEFNFDVLKRSTF